MRRDNAKRLLALAAAGAAVWLAWSASNPEVEEPECEPVEEEECLVVPPSALCATGTAGCASFEFRLVGVTNGLERHALVRRWRGPAGAACMPDETLEETVRELEPQVTWTASAGGSAYSGAGLSATFPRGTGVCSAACSFIITCLPSRCPRPAPAVLTAEARFTDGVALLNPDPGPVCVASDGHPSHIFPYDSCEEPAARVEPGDAASAAVYGDGTVRVTGLRWHEGARLIVEAPCGTNTVTFDVADLAGLRLYGCGCFAPEADPFETMGGEVTAAQDVLPAKYAGSARVAAAAGGGWTVTGWFDCNGNGEPDADEPKTVRDAASAALGSLSAAPLEDAGNGESNGTEVFAPGSVVEFENRLFAPGDRAHTLAVIETRAEDGLLAMTVPLGPVPPAGLNVWRMAIPDGCPDGEFVTVLSDPFHACAAVTNRFCVRSCGCSSCEAFGQAVTGGDGVDIALGLGRTLSGGAKAPIRIRQDTTSAMPSLAPLRVPDGRVDVLYAGGAAHVAFTRAGEAAPAAEYTLTPGAGRFTLLETRGGTPRRLTAWSRDGSAWTMETLDPSSEPPEPVASVRTERRAVPGGTAVRVTRGGLVTETEYRPLSGGGSFAARETRGTGDEALTTLRAPVDGGPAAGRVLSEVRPDGSWALYGYDAAGRLSSATVPFGDTPPVLGGDGDVTGWDGPVRRTDYAYDPVDPRDDGALSPFAARSAVERVGSAASGWTETSRAYRAEYLDGGERVVVEERAASPGAAYGAAGSPRTVSRYRWRDPHAGRLALRATPDGLVTRRTFTLAGGRVTETVTAPAARPGGVPFRTTASRVSENARGDVTREETWLVTGGERALLAWTDYERDAAGRVLRRVDSSGSAYEAAWGCCGPEWERDELGTVTDYAYDAAGRRILASRAGVTELTAYDAAGNATNVTRLGVSPGLPALSASSSSGYDSAGRLAWTVSEDGIRTEYARGVSPGGGEVLTAVRGAGTACAVTNTTVRLRDGTERASLLNRSPMATSVREPFAAVTYAGPDGAGSPRWTREETDFLGRTVRVSRPGFGGSTLVTSNAYDTAGRLVGTFESAVPPAPAEPVPIRNTLIAYDELGGRAAVADDRDFDGEIGWSGPDLVATNLTRYVLDGGAWWRETALFSVHLDGSDAALPAGARRERVTGLGGGGLAAETAAVDPRGNVTVTRVYRDRDAAEEVTLTDSPGSLTPAVTVSTNGLEALSVSRTGVTNSVVRDALGRPAARTDGRGGVIRTGYDALGRVASETDALGHTTAYGYDALGRRTSVTGPLGATVSTAYDAEGRVLSVRGAAYPVDYAYDGFGDRVSMTTYRDAGAAGDTTRWLRDAATGLVTNKVYADGSGPSYAYSPDGRPVSRAWARGTVTAYGYDACGALTNVVHSDGTPTVSLAYDRAGRLVRAEDAAGVTAFAYDEYGSVTNETAAGVAGTNVIERYWDAFGRPLGYALNGVRRTALAYDPATGRLASMSAGGSSAPFVWSYLPGTDLKSQLAYPNGLAASWQYDAGNRLTRVRNDSPGGVISQYDYTCDAEGRRVRVSRSGSAMSGSRADAYGHNARGELVSAAREGAPPATPAEHEYEYDDIGNRITSSDLGASRAYAANGLNQYTAITDGSGTFGPRFDPDGNQTLVRTRTGTWSVSYDAENRPVLWSCGGTNVVMSFDRMGRRVSCAETVGAVTNAHRAFVYDGYLQIADSDGNACVWDPTEPVATRPLARVRGGSAYFFTHDGNKNVSELADGSGAVAAHYEYAPFGEVTFSSGDLDAANPFRFSSEYADDALGLVYYNYRHYDPVMGRWEGRDIEIGINVYAFLYNSPCVDFDLLGFVPVKWDATPFSTFSQWDMSLYRDIDFPEFQSSDPYLSMLINQTVDMTVDIYAYIRYLKGIRDEEYLTHCPCHINGARVEDGWSIPRRSSHDGGDMEVRREFPNGPTTFGRNAGQQCVYDKCGRLITIGKAAGTPDNYSYHSDDASLKEKVLHGLADAKAYAIAHYLIDKPLSWLNIQTDVATQLDHFFTPPDKGMDPEGNPCPDNDGDLR